MEQFRILALLTISLLLAGCGLSASVSEESDPYSDEQSYSRSMSFESMDRFEEAHMRDRARVADHTRGGLWRSLARLPTIRQTQDAMVQDVGRPLVYTPECLELQAVGRNPARCLSASR